MRALSYISVPNLAEKHVRKLWESHEVPTVRPGDTRSYKTIIPIIHLARK